MDPRMAEQESGLFKSERKRERERMRQGLKEEPGAEFLKETERVLTIGFISRRS